MPHILRIVGAVGTDEFHRFAVYYIASHSHSTTTPPRLRLRRTSREVMGPLHVVHEQRDNF
jgi:hypothetical protein